MGLQQLGKLLILAAVVLALVGGLLWVFGRAGLGVRVGSLPGDVHLRGNGWSCFIPITTSILLSLLLTIVVTLIVRLLR